MEKLVKAAAVLVTATVFLGVLAETKAVLGTELDTEESARHRRSTDDRKDWLKDATARVQFQALSLYNDRLMKYLDNNYLPISEVNFPTFPASKTCQKMSDNIPYGTDVYQEGQGDLLARTKAFRFLLAKAAACLRDSPSSSSHNKLLNRAASVDTSLAVFVVNITDLCEKRCKPAEQGEQNCSALKELCHKSMDEYVADVGDSCYYFNQGEDPDYGSGQNTYYEQIDIVSTYLECFLHRLEYQEPVVCTASGPQPVS